MRKLSIDRAGSPSVTFKEEDDCIMKKAKLGDRVRVQYLGLREDGVAVERCRGRKVLEFTVGGNEVIPGISFGVLGMAEGEQKRLTLQPKDAYGPVETKLIKEVSRQRFPAHLKLRVGQRLTATGVKSGRRRQVSVAELRLHTVVVDGNHPLAGEILEVELQVVSLNSSSGNEDKARQSFRSVSGNHPNRLAEPGAESL
jgi:peptidylprolyl isomerase